MTARLALAALMLAPVAALAQSAALTPVETAAFAAKVQPCWTPAPGTSPRVTISFAMGADGRPDPDSFAIVGTASQDAFDAAKRAVLRCAGAGYDLPKDRHDLWDQIQMTFTADGIGSIT